MLLADKRDYNNGFRKHYAAYKRMSEDNSDISSRRLLLTYCVECGLKYKLLQKWGMANPKELLTNRREELSTAERKRRDVLSSHNLEKILKELGHLGMFKFPQPTTVHNERVSCEEYHQLYRYCISTDDTVRNDKVEQCLRQILEWLSEGV